MKLIFEYIKKYRKEAVLAPTFKLLEACFELLVPLVMANIIDVGIANKDRNYIFVQAGWLFALAAIGFTVAVIAQYFAAKAAVFSAKDIRNDLFARIMGFSFTKLDTIGLSTLITRLTNDINQVQSGVNMVLRLFLRSPIIVFGAMIMAFTVDWKSALIFVVLIPLLAVVVGAVLVLTMPLNKKVQGALDKVLRRTKENITGTRVIRAFTKEEIQKQIFEEDNHALKALQLKSGGISAYMNPVTYVLVNLGIAVLLYSGAIRVNVGALTQGQVVALVNYMNQILVELIKLANTIVLASKMFSSADRVSKVMYAEDPEAVAGELALAQDDEKVIEFKNVSFIYSGAGAESLKNISFSLKVGETLGIIGPTGSGKSTLINLMSGFYKASSGEILLYGKNINDYTEEARTKIFGIVAQKAALFSGSIKDNLKYADENATDEDIFAAIEMACAKDVIDSKEEGIDFEILQGGKNLSGGQKQRLSIARALIGKKKVLIFDDSSSALDYATDARLNQNLKKLDDCAKVIISQRASSIRHADNIIVLEDGEMVAMGTNDELVANCETYRQIYKTQYSLEVQNG